MSPVTNRWEMAIGEVFDVKQLLKTNNSADIVGSVYLGIAKSVEAFTGKDVVYKKIVPRLGKLAVDRTEVDL